MGKKAEWLAAGIAACLGISLAASPAAVFETAPNGSAQGPVFSLAAALIQSAALPGRANRQVKIILHGGIYELPAPICLTEHDSGLTIAAARRERPVLSGRAVIRRWSRSPANPNIWQSTIPEVREGGWIFHELSVNGQRRPRTRLPAEGWFQAAGAAPKNHPQELVFHPGEILPEWAASGDVELVSYQAWAQTRNQIRAVITESNIVSLAGDAQLNGVEKPPRFFIENAPIDLAPGQWRLDSRTGVLSYYPQAGEDMDTAVISAPRLYDLLRVIGEPAHPVKNITLRGIEFADADWRLDGGSDLDPQAAVEVPGAVQFQNAANCVVDQCEFKRLGGYGLELGTGCRGVTVSGGEFHDLGAGGIRIGAQSRNEAIESPCDGNIISDNHIHDLGLVNAPGVGIFVLMSSGNHITHNEVDHTRYTAVSVGWSWGYGPAECRSNVIDYNLLHDIGQGVLSDMGGVYTLGLQPGAVVRGNVIHDVRVFGYGGWGLYTDEGSSGITLEGNLVYHCQSSGFHQHYGQNNIVRGNILALNRDFQIMRTRIEHGRAFTFSNNLVYFDSGRVFGGKWGEDVELDHNLYFDSRPAATRQNLDAVLADLQTRGHDRHSRIEDPLFENPRRNDFRLRPESPALRMGFKQIAAGEAGIRRGRGFNGPKEPKP